MKQLKEKISLFCEKHTVLCLVLIFLVGIILYGTVSKLMTNPMYLIHDEELYVNMARSFFFDYNFSRGYELLNYSCVFYSIVLSFAYFFYTPENIVFLMRMIGVIVMTSSVFPIFLLSKKILGSKKKALIISAISLIIPEMSASAYLIQENFSYPIFLWTAYLIYLKFTSKTEKNIKYDLTIIFLFALNFFTKSYTIVFAFAYFFTIFIESIRKKEYKKIKSIFIQGAIFCILIVIRTNINKCYK